MGEFSGLNNELKKSLVRRGHDVVLAAASDYQKKYPADINLGYGSNLLSYKFRQLYRPFLNYKYFVDYDVVHIINPYVIPRNCALNLMLVKYLKSKNGIVTLSGAGSDPFFVQHSQEVLRYSPIPSHIKHDRGGRRYYMASRSHYDFMRRYMESVDGIIPIMYEYYSTFIAAGYLDKTSEPIPIPVDISGINCSENNLLDGKVVFFHGLNRPGFKGTHLIKTCFDRLSKKYPDDVECIIDGNMAFENYLRLMQRMNVVVDQVYSYSLAMNALYSMAQGKLLCGGVEAESSMLYAGNLPPAINIMPDIDQISNVMENIVENKELIAERSIKMRCFVEKYHSPDSVSEKYLNYWQSLL
ncbi:hypothetical protein LWH48_17055 [Halomonas sp. G15]|uniref:hypothetical protein n=1 Tax=Halomonas sp. G15 TaxID=2903521 RepID=UPI001E3072C6|nr:hypothetical protein [Halomonas sp. G15]MCE0734472.1 hypothetical protein [Halomonas sp. G15]